MGRSSGAHGRASRPLVLAALAVAVGAGALTGCGDDDADAGGRDPSRSRGAARPADAALTVQIDRVGESLRIGWSVTNDGDADLVLFDGRQADDAPDADMVGAYVTAGNDAGVEIARRVFPVPDGVEVDGAMPGTTGVRLRPGDVASGRELVVLPPEYLPAAPAGGGEPPPGDATSAVFCMGVGPLDALDARPSADASDRYFVRHSESNADQQTLLCGDPVEL